jgi:hypothetical protein
MTETIGITTILNEIGPEGLMLSLGKGLLQLALIIACVVIIRKILKKQDAAKNKGAGLHIGWSVDEAAERQKLEQKDTSEE